MEHPAIAAFLADVARLDWVTDVWLSGSSATGDHRPGSSDIDLVAVTSRALGSADRSEVAAIHRGIDRGAGRGALLGCAYVDGTTLADRPATHPAWTHGRLVDRHLSPIARAELVVHGRALVGRDTRDVLPTVSPDDVREAARAELTGHWSWAVRRPWLFPAPRPPISPS